MITFIRTDADRAKKLRAFLPNGDRHVTKDYMPIYENETLLRVVPASVYEELKTAYDALHGEKE